MKFNSKFNSSMNYISDIFPYYGFRKELSYATFHLKQYSNKLILNTYT